MASTKMNCIDGGAYVAQAAAQAKSIIDEARVWALIQVAMMAAQRSSASGIADIQAELNTRRVRLAEELLAHAKKAWVEKKRFVDDAMSEGYHQPVYGTAVAMVAEGGLREDNAKEMTEKALARLGVTQTPCDESRIGRGMAVARTDLVSHLMRSAEARAVALNDRRWSRQLAAVGMGRGVLQNALSMGALADNGQTVRDSLVRTFNSGMALWGYSANRWSHGANYITGEKGAPMVVPQGWAAYRTDGFNQDGRPVVYMQQERSLNPLDTQESSFDRSVAPVQAGA